MRKRRFRDTAEFDQQQARAAELLKTSDSFILFHFDAIEGMTEVVSAVAMEDVPYALHALEAQGMTIAIRAIAMMLKNPPQE